MWAVAATILMWLAIAPASFAASPTIAGAPALSMGARVSGGGSNAADFYSVALRGGEKLQLSVDPAACSSGCSDYEFDLYAPGTTDASFTRTPPVDMATTTPPYGGSPQAITVQAPYTGTYVLAACEPTDFLDDRGDCRQTVTTPSNMVKPMGAYALTPSLVGGGITQDCAASEVRASRTIASAAALAMGGCGSGGANPIDFWTVGLNGGDQLQFTVYPPSDGTIELNLYAPGTSDATFTQAPPVDTTLAAWSGSGGAGQVVTLQAPYTGTFVLAACAPADDVDPPDCREIQTGGARRFVVPMPPYAFSSSLIGVGADCAAGETRAGVTIAAAPGLTPGACEAGGGNATDFWNVSLGAAGLQFTVTPPDSVGVEFDIYAAGTTDTTFTQAAPVDSGTVSPGSAGTVTLHPPTAGTYVLAVCEPHGTTGDCRSIRTGSGRDFELPMRPYTFTTAVPAGGVAGGGSPSDGGYGGYDYGSYGSYGYGDYGSTSTDYSSAMTIARQTIKVSKKHTVSIKVACAKNPCSGTLKLTATVSRTTGHGSKRKTRKTTTVLGTAPFSYIDVGTSHVTLTLNSAALKLLHHAHGRLTATATASYDTGTKTTTAHGTVALHGT